MGKKRSLSAAAEPTEAVAEDASSEAGRAANGPGARASNRAHAASSDAHRASNGAPGGDLDELGDADESIDADDRTAGSPKGSTGFTDADQQALEAELGAAPAAALADEAVSATRDAELVAARGSSGAASAESDSSAELDASAEAANGEPPEPAAEVLTGEELENAVLALLFASPEALSLARLAALLPGTSQDSVRDALSALAERMQLAKLPLELRELAGGWRVLTTPAQAWIVARLARQRKNEKVSPAALETLSIVAYRQPVTKAEIEAIRGVQAGPVLRSLIDRRLVKVCGRAEQPGSPLQYGTTREFLDQFGLGSLQDLPRDAELVKD